MSAGRNAALVTVSIGGLAALAAWSMLIYDLLAWQAPRIAVVPPIAGAVLPRVEVMRIRPEPAASSALAQPSGDAVAAQQAETAATAGDSTLASMPEAAAEPSGSAATGRLDALMGALQSKLDGQREIVRARTTGTAPPGIPLPADVVTCGGLRARGVERVAYLIDCSARSEPHIERMCDEVVRSAARLGDAQSFAVIACRSSWAEVAPPGAMRKGGSSFGSAVASDLKAWLRKAATPQGPPQIYSGIETAMATRPELIVLVSAGLANPGDGDDARDAALAAFDRANPRDAASGRRPARVMTLVAGGQDPKGVLAAISSAHAAGAPLHAALDAPPTAAAEREVASPAGARPEGADARLVNAMRLALADPADPASARALLEATVIADSTGWPREHVIRMARAAARRAHALGLDEIAAEADAIARRAAEGAGQ